MKLIICPMNFKSRSQRERLFLFPLLKQHEPLARFGRVALFGGNGQAEQDLRELFHRRRQFALALGDDEGRQEFWKQLFTGGTNVGTALLNANTFVKTKSAFPPEPAPPLGGEPYVRVRATEVLSSSF